MGFRCRLEQGRYYGLGMDAVGNACNWNMDVIMVWAWMPLAWLRKHVVGLGSLKKPGLLNALYPHIYIYCCYQRGLGWAGVGAQT